MGSVGNNVPATTFVYTRSADIKEWSLAEEKRSSDMSAYVNNMINRGGFYEFYEENPVEDLDSYTIPAGGGFREEEVSITKMNLTYASNWDENDRRVKQGKAVTGSTYYVVQTENGSIDESQFAYKTKADAQHAMQLYIDREKQRRAFWDARR